VGSVHLWQNAVRPVKKHRSGGAGAEGDDPGEAQSLRQGSLRCKYTGLAYDGLKTVILVHYKRRCSVHPLNSCVVC
jgi:hypothetical protein